MKSLHEQVYAIYRRCNRGAVNTRKRYLVSALKLCDYVEKRFGLEKFKNLNDKHIRAFVQYEREQCVPDTTILTDLNGIYFFYEFSGGENVLPDKREFGFEKTLNPIENILWTREEVEKAIRLAELQGNSMIKNALRMSSVENISIDEISVRLTDKMRMDTDSVKNRIRNWVHNNRRKFADRQLTFGGTKGVLKNETK